MTYGEKVQWLMRYREIDEDIKDVEVEYRQKKEFLKKQEEAVTVCRGNWVKARREMGEEHLRELEGKISHWQRRRAEIGDEISGVIDRLPDTRQRNVLREIYLTGCSQEAVAKILHHGKMWVSRQHKEGVKALEIAEK